MINTIIVSLAFLLFVWLSYRKRTRSLVEQEGRADSINTLSLVATLLATAIGGALIFGLIQFGQISGGIGILLAVAYCGAFIALGMFAPFIRQTCRAMKERGLIGKKENLSLSLLLSKKYTKWAWTLILFAYVLIYIAFLAAQYVALAKIAKAMGFQVSTEWTIILGAVAICLYVSIAGYRAVIGTDVIQLGIIFLIFIVGLVLVALHCISHGMNFSTLPNGYWNPLANPELASTFVWLVVFILPTLILRIDHWQRITTALDDKTARKGYIIAGFILAVVFLTLLSIGFANRIDGNGDPFYLYKAYILGSGGLLQEIVYGFALCGFLLVVVSSADTVLNSGAATITQTLESWGIIKTDAARPLIVVSCLMSFIAVVMALLRPNNVVVFVTEGFKVMTILLPTIVFAILFKKPSSLAAAISIISGIFTWLCVKLLWENQGHWGFVMSFAVSAILIIAVYKVEKQWNHGK